jgi:G5-linked-Ubiquitin-like domain/Lytic transglycolase
VLAGTAYAVPRVFAGGGASGPEVELTIGDKVTTISTEAATVGAVLEAENVRLHAADEVTPPLDTPITDGMSVVVDLAVPITINLDGALTDVRSAADSVDQMLASVPELQRTKFESDPAAPIDPGAPLVEGAVYTFRTPRSVVLVTGGAREEFRTPALTVRELLSRRGIFPADGDYVSLPLDTPIPIEGTTEVQFRTELEMRAFIDALTPTAPVGVGGPTYADGRPVGPGGGPVPGPAGLPQSGTSEVGTATHYEFTPGTCAHLTLPFGTVVTVRNTATGATATCTVADRGPEEWTGHIIDLTPGVFAQLASLSQGVVHVEISW